MAFGGQSEKDRFRSFAERYVIARAPEFRLGFEKEDAWRAVQDAKTMYEHIGDVGQILEAQQYGVAEGDANVAVATQQGATSAPSNMYAYPPGSPVTAALVKKAQHALMTNKGRWSPSHAAECLTVEQIKEMQQALLAAPSVKREYNY